MSNVRCLAQLCFISFLSLLSSACVPGQQSIAATTTKPASLVSAGQPTVTLMPSLQPTTPGPQATFTSTPSPTPQSSPTATRLPELSLAEQQKLMKELVRTNGNCVSPCVWGIVPNQTTWAEARNFLLSMDQTLKMGGISFTLGNTDNNQGDLGGGIFIVREELVVGIELGMFLDIRNKVRGDWAAFTPEGIFARYGVPSEILFWHRSMYRPSPPDGKFIDYIEMTLFYDSLDVVVTYYEGFSPLKGNSYHYCPAPLDYSSVHFAIWVGKAAPDLPLHNQGILLEDVSALTRQEFFQQVIQNPGTACFDLEAKAFEGQK